MIHHSWLSPLKEKKIPFFCKNSSSCTLLSSLRSVIFVYASSFSSHLLLSPLILFTLPCKNKNLSSTTMDTQKGLKRASVNQSITGSWWLLITLRNSFYNGYHVPSLRHAPDALACGTTTTGLDMMKLGKQVHHLRMSLWSSEAKDLSKKRGT